MMRGWIVFALVMALAVQTASATMMEVEIIGSVKKSLNVASIDGDGRIIRMDLGIHNTGSFAYDARARMDIISGEKIFFTGWSTKESIAPGGREGFVIYGIRPDVENLSVRLRTYYGNEMEESETLYLDEKQDDIADAKHAFSILNFRVYDNLIRFDLQSNQSLENVAVFVRGYPGTWIFEQESIGSIGSNGIKEVTIPYETGFFQELGVSIVTATEDGEYYQEHDFVLKKESGFMKYVNMLFDFAFGIFRS